MQRKARARAPARKGDRRPAPPSRAELFGLLTVSVAGFALLATLVPAGTFGLAVARFLREWFGFGGTLVAAAALVAGLRTWAARRFPPWGKREWGSVLTLLLVPTWLSVVAGTRGGGNVGEDISRMLRGLLGLPGEIWLLVLLSLAAGSGLAGMEVRAGYRRLTGAIARRRSRRPSPLPPSPRGAPEEPPETGGPSPALEEDEPEPVPPEPAAAAPKEAPSEEQDAPAVVEVAAAAGGVPADSPYPTPPLSLFAPPVEPRRGKGDLQARARLLEDTLRDFGVAVRVVDATQGPAVTRFEVQPAPGVKVSRIVSLADDIALAMAAPDVRIEAPIPGKSAVGIEVPHAEVTPVRLREVLESPAYKESPSPLTVALGKDIAGRPIVAALDRMPHLLIAGATGAGKSVCINAIICSLLYRASPAEVRLVLVDPKVVELKHFDGIPHLLVPVVTDPKKAAGVLRGIIREMEQRYERFAARGVRDLVRYNQAAREAGEQPLPYVVVIIDELADLMMVAPAEVEDSICRLAQLARAAGIHLVVATQRPSVDVITGLIKANIPSRLSFAVSSQVDSRTILDQAGAEKLLGKGDMLFAPIGRSKPVRAQGVYVSDEEVEALVAYVKAASAPQYHEGILRAQEEEAPRETPVVDELFPEALRVVVEARQASASLLQRRMRIGYSRAARLVDAMEERGYVGPQEGARPREVRIGPAELARVLQEQGFSPPKEVRPEPRKAEE